MKRLPETLKKNGISYQMILRSERVVLWELSLQGTRIGYEVSHLNFHLEQKKFDRVFPARESLPSDSGFGLDGSKCFFAGEFKRSSKYYEMLSSMHSSQE